MDENRQTTTAEPADAGWLRFSIHTANYALPVDGALITIYSSEAQGEGDVLANILTDADGETGRISLPTPLISNSFDPESQAYYSYYVSVTHPGFTTQAGIPVKVFPAATTILQLNLMPKA